MSVFGLKQKKLVYKITIISIIALTQNKLMSSQQIHQNEVYLIFSQRDN